jgi:hypothetical protein
MTIVLESSSPARSFAPLTRIRWINRSPDRPKRCLQTGKRCFTNRGGSLVLMSAVGPIPDLRRSPPLRRCWGNSGHQNEKAWLDRSGLFVGRRTPLRPACPSLSQGVAGARFSPPSSRSLPGGPGPTAPRTPAGAASDAAPTQTVNHQAYTGLLLRRL